MPGDDAWSPAFTIEKMLTSVLYENLMNPYFEDPVNFEATELWKKSNKEFFKKAKEWT